jgi:collagenase-like PrtC family protease
MVPENLNRNTSALRKLASNKAKLGFELGTIVNTLCLIDCPFRDFHYCFASHGTCGREYLVNDYYGDRCQLIRSGNPVELLKAPWIRPEDIKEYERIGVDCFKILGREFGKSADFVKVVDIYNKGSFDGNLIELLTCFSDQNFSRMFVMQNKSLGEFTRRFLDHENVCTTKNCEMCNYCNTNARLVSTNNVDSWRETFIKDRYALFK